MEKKYYYLFISWIQKKSSQNMNFNPIISTIIILYNVTYDMHCTKYYFVIDIVPLLHVGTIQQLWAQQTSFLGIYVLLNNDGFPQ